MGKKKRHIRHDESLPSQSESGIYAILYKEYGYTAEQVNNKSIISIRCLLRRLAERESDLADRYDKITNKDSNDYGNN